MAESPRRRSLIASGVVIVVVGLIGAIAMWAIAGERRSSAIGDLAHAPVGCDTTLDFAESGSYFLFVETKGEIGEIRGDCDVVGEYDAAEVGPDESFQILDPDGDSLDLDPSDSIGYDDGGFVGEAAREFEVAEPGDHVVRVQSGGDEIFVAAIGRDPADGVAALRVGAVAVAATALILGGLAVVLGARRRPSSAPASPSAPWPGAPGFTPGQAPPGPPVYGQSQSPPATGQYPSNPPPMPPAPPSTSPWAPSAPPPPPPAPAPIPGEAGFGSPPIGAPVDAPAPPPPPSPGTSSPGASPAPVAADDETVSWEQLHEQAANDDLTVRRRKLVDGGDGTDTVVDAGDPHDDRPPPPPPGVSSGA